MWTTDLFLVLLGLICGLSVAAGAFALIAGLGLIPRLAGKTSVASFVIPLENAVIYGGIFGAVIALFDQIPLRVGCWFTVVYGLSAGVFTGCLSVALAEVLNVFPIVFRRVKIKQGLNLMVFFFALGKAAGALYYFVVLFS
ncbi:MAG: stage V sporulation protein AB [Clostridiales bacterium]|nr:stage V sporulation protein AB [Clostridiales bacterium]MCD8108555.1 stage V sporulation protein AB [Clostridiales bacterium]MCD8133856.1 stage V sporulation protein AB [Clostridiales bacterium]